MSKQFYLQMYKEFAPDIDVSDKLLKDIQKHYNGNTFRFTKDFNSQILNPKGQAMDVGTVDRIYKSFQDELVDNRQLFNEQQEINEHKVNLTITR